MAKPYRERPQDVHANNIHTLKERIKNMDLDGCFIFYGEEEFLKNHYTDLLMSAADSSLNVTTFYSSDFNLTDFISACSTSAVESFDMFSMDEDDNDENDSSSLRVIKVYSPDFSSLSKKDGEYLCEFLCELPEKTVVIFWLYSGNEDAVGKGLLKKISENALTVNFKKEPVGSSVLITWIIRHFSKEKMNIERHVAVHLCGIVGNSMTDLRCEITKLIDYLKYENRDTLQKEDVDFVCIKSKEAQAFDISGGALSGDFPKAARALKILRDKREAPMLIFGAISKAVSDLCATDKYIREGIPTATISKMTGTPEFIIKNSAGVLNARRSDFTGDGSFAKTASRLCFEYDKKIKSSRTDGYELLLELIFKLSYAGKIIG